MEKRCIILTLAFVATFAAGFALGGAYANQRRQAEMILGKSYPDKLHSEISQNVRILTLMRSNNVSAAIDVVQLNLRGTITSWKAIKSNQLTPDESQFLANAENVVTR
jgi:hypothetical protein